MAGAGTVVDVRPGDTPVVHVVAGEEVDQLVVALVRPGDWAGLRDSQAKAVSILIKGALL